MDAIITSLQGKKSYLTAAATVITGVVMFLNGAVDIAGLLQFVLTGTGLATLRAGVSKGAS